MNERLERRAKVIYEFNTEAKWPPDHDRQDWLDLASEVLAVDDAERLELREELERRTLMLQASRELAERVIVGLRLRAEKAEATIKRVEDALAWMASWESGYDTRQVIRKAVDDDQCPGFEGNPVAPDMCAGCHAPHEQHPGGVSDD